MKKSQLKMPGEIKGKYNPLAFEQKIYWHWFENKYFFEKRSINQKFHSVW